MKEISYLINMIYFSLIFFLNGQEVSLFFCTDSYIKQLNKTYRNIDNATDVLSFENGEEYEDEEGKWLCIGDIIISLETLGENSLYFEENKDDEFKRLLVHGLLYLNGKDLGQEHIQKGVEPECEMLKIQEKVLQKFKDEKIIV